jgi:osmotically-inducible protein OsmY
MAEREYGRDRSERDWRSAEERDREREREREDRGRWSGDYWRSTSGYGMEGYGPERNRQGGWRDERDQSREEDRGWRGREDRDEPWRYSQRTQAWGAGGFRGQDWTEGARERNERRERGDWGGGWQEGAGRSQGSGSWAESGRGQEGRYGQGNPYGQAGGYGGGQSGYGSGFSSGGQSGYGGYGGQSGYGSGTGSGQPGYGGYGGQSGYGGSSGQQWYGSGQAGYGSGQYGSSGGQYQRERRDRIARPPRGYKRSDERIREDVCEAIVRAWDLDAGDVDVQVQGTEVTLSGVVEDRHDKRRIEDIAQDVPGVSEVNNQLRTRQGSSFKEALARTGEAIKQFVKGEPGRDDKNATTPPTASGTNAGNSPSSR